VHFPAVVPADLGDPLSLKMKMAPVKKKYRPMAFTLIEIMIVVAIIGLIASMGVPSILQTFRKEGMRKAVSDIMDLCGDARTQAIISGQPAQIDFYPADRRMELAGTASGEESPATPVKSAKPVTLPADVDIAMLDIDMIDCGGQQKASVKFNPNGTSDELTLVLHSGDEWQKITLEYCTALASVGPVTR
jgi:type II secretion system protein H